MKMCLLSEGKGRVKNPGGDTKQPEREEAKKKGLGSHSPPSGKTQLPEINSIPVRGVFGSEVGKVNEHHREGAF